MQASEVSVPKRPSPGRFARSGRLFFLVCPPPHLHRSVCLSVLHAPPLCPMRFDPLLLFPCPSSLTNTTFRVSWWIAFLLWCHQSTRAGRLAPPLSSPPYPSPPFKHLKVRLFFFCPSPSDSFHFFLPPFSLPPSLIWLCARTCGLASALVSPSFSLQQMAFKAKALV